LNTENNLKIPVYSVVTTLSLVEVHWRFVLTYDLHLQIIMKHEPCRWMYSSP